LFCQANRPIGGARLSGSGLRSFAPAFLIEVIENPLDRHQVLDAGNDLHGPAAGRTGLNVDTKDAIYSVLIEILSVRVKYSG
jgi:hypothetical protein